MTMGLLDDDFLLSLLPTAPGKAALRCAAVPT